MTITPLLDPRIHAARARLRDLESLRSRIDDEIRQIRAVVAPTTVRLRRSRHDLPPCGTESAYQRHRHLWRKYQLGVWPLPEDDPCGCRAAHRKHQADVRGRAA